MTMVDQSVVDELVANHQEELGSLRTQLEAATRVPPVSEDEATQTYIDNLREENLSLRTQLNTIRLAPQPE